MSRSIKSLSVSIILIVSGELVLAPTAFGATIALRTNQWFLTAPVRPPIPAVKQKSWPRAPMYNFMLAKLEEKRIAPAALADKATLLRRATFDLHGLPPTPAELKAFLADRSRTAFAKVIDRLLASPRSWERWGRPWLDLAPLL